MERLPSLSLLSITCELSLQLYESFMKGEKVCDPESVTPEQWQYIQSLRSPAARRKEFCYIGLVNYLEEKHKVRELR